MSVQSPLIAVPRKTTTDVDWATPIRHVIAASYGEDPNSYAEECAVLQRCRQDAVRGAGNDQTARDLLYKYFGQLELLELRFAEIKVSFPWNDAFTDKLTTQTSLAFEKASIIHLISSILSSLAQSASRSDPEGLKRAYYNTRATAGMLTYINENFLHAPSTDLSREVVHLLIGIMMAQAAEIFTEKLVEEKKSASLVARSANQTASMYTSVVDEMKEFQGKGVFDRNWLYVLQIKAKLFGSLAQYYKATSDSAAGKHGTALVRLKIANSLIQDAQKQASSFIYTFVAASTPSLPHDAANALNEIVKAHATVCGEAKEQAVKDNDLIYHEVLPSEASLPAIEKLPPAAPITIQDVYGNQEVTKLIGPDIFLRLVPLAVHESASVYSEEKAKLVRAEVDKVELAEGEIQAGLDHLNLPEEIDRWRQFLEGDTNDDVPLSQQLKSLVDSVGDVRQVENDLGRLDGERAACERELRELNGALDAESRECERMRAKYTPNFTQSPSGPQTANLRSNLSANLSALSSASTSDAHLQSLWQSIQPSISLLSSGPSNLERAARDITEGNPQKIDKTVSLLDLDDEEVDRKALGQEEKDALRKAVDDGREKLDRLKKIRAERDEVLRDLKEKIQTDDVSNLLLLNRRSQNVEPQLFASELEKFRPYQTRLAAAVSASRSILQELDMLVAQVHKGTGFREILRKEKDRQRIIRDWEKRLIEAGESYAEIRAGLGKGLSYYDSLRRVIEDLRMEVQRFTNSREQERRNMVSDIETRQRLGGTSPSTGGVVANRGLEERLAALKMEAPPQPPRLGTTSTPNLPPPPGRGSSNVTSSYLPPPPPPKPQSNPYDFSTLAGFGSFATPSVSSPQHVYPSQPQQAYNQQSYIPPQQNPYYPPPPSRPTYASPPFAPQQPPMQSGHSPYAPPPGHAPQPQQPQYPSSQNQQQRQGYKYPGYGQQGGYGGGYGQY
ncbi:hypothetical protein CNG02100 [Cryptococcus deneoformans JEC21]|uniref:Vacuolar protein-sorting protein BRO1 n=1 Tax=Cryptococcus deneoformans (strain JEC21 / ATCC MYA-565) TaxID=214684 RepID=BRO1_CRYD1|nr:hypothetical protein CNG02100 [Cryptococcus neoformans var. neoformans JEC21]P0CM44.1 RecName: Full=Vacuolar protein-sorting protein BRO1; AltName: Full=BRO domain-containing protein 1 [Cryptococcus neoformans var. neoformans JEC21]AAW44609.1 hypothetical protein CNG02100 [Cryptococcus neoformans var. neoformans JEC21]